MNDFESGLNTLLVDTFNNILKYEERSLRRISSQTVTVSEAHLIEAIGKLRESATVTDIASNLRVAIPTVTVSLKRLEKKGIVTKLPSGEDGRRVIVGLTDTGRRLNRAHSLFHHKMVKSINDEFSEQERELLFRAISKLNSFFASKTEDT